MADLDYREMFAYRLRALRVAADLTIEEASARGDLSPTFWGTVERKEQEPCLNSIFGFAKGIGVSALTLLAFDGENGRRQDRQELNSLLDLVTPEQLRFILEMSRLIHKYRIRSQS